MEKAIVMTTRIVPTYREAICVHVMRDIRATESSVQVSAASTDLVMIHYVGFLESFNRARCTGECILIF